MVSSNKNPKMVVKKKSSPKYKIELFSKATDEGNEENVRGPFK